MRHVFWNPVERRLRAAWRILLIQAPFWAAFIALDGLHYRIVRPWLESQGSFGGLLSRRQNVVFAALTVLSLWVAARFVDRRPFADFGFHLNRTWWRYALGGFGVGLFVQLLPNVLRLAAGDTRVVSLAHNPWPGVPFAVGLFTALTAAILIGLIEEGMCRAHPLKNLAEGLVGALGPSSPTAPLFVVFVPAAGFAFAHAINGGAYWIQAVFFLWSFGVIFGCIYHVTGSLAFPIGLHAGWDFAAMFVFPANPSRDVSLIRVEPTGAHPRIWWPNDNLYLLLLMAGTLLWWASRLGRPGFRSPLERYAPPALGGGPPPRSLSQEGNIADTTARQFPVRDQR